MRFITKKEKGNANGKYKKQKFPKLPIFEPKVILRKKDGSNKEKDPGPDET